MSPRCFLTAGVGWMGAVREYFQVLADRFWHLLFLAIVSRRHVGGWMSAVPARFSLNRDLCGTPVWKRAEMTEAGK